MLILQIYNKRINKADWHKTSFLLRLSQDVKLATKLKNCC